MVFAHSVEVMSFTAVKNDANIHHLNYNKIKDIPIQEGQVLKLVL